MKLSDAALVEFRITLALINQHEISLKSLNQYLSSIVGRETGVDFTKELWVINTDTGELTPHNPTHEGEDERAE